MTAKATATAARSTTSNANKKSFLLVIQFYASRDQRTRASAGTFVRAPPAEKLGQGGSGEPVSWDRAEEGEHRHTFAEVDVRHLVRETNMPATGCPLVLLRLKISE